MENQKPKFIKNLKLERTIPKDLTSYFVSDLAIQHDEDRFILSFFEIWPPLIIGESEDERVEQLKKIDSLEVKCVARLVVSPSRMKLFKKAIDDNLKKFEDSEKSG